MFDNDEITKFDSDEIANSLPPFRDGEPGSLRQDIIDEILDHLECDFRRELLVRGDDKLTAKQRVLNRFGDPRRIARQLWYQAMWSRIMTQRLMIGGTILSLVASISMIAFAGLVIQRQDQQQRAQQQLNAALLNQISNLMAQQSDSTSGKPLLKIRLTKGDNGASAAAGFHVVVDRQHDLGKPYFDSVPAILVTDKMGIAECGSVEPGRFTLTISTPWGEASESTFIVRPGHEHVEQVVVPASRPDLTDVVITTEGLPGDLNLDHSVLIATFSPTGVRDFSGRSWKLADTKLPWDSIPFVLFLPNQGSRIPGTWISAIPRNWWSGNSNWVPGGTKHANWEPLESPQPWRVPAGEYSVSFVLLNVTEIVGPYDSKWQGSIQTNSYREFGGQPKLSNQLEAGPIELKAETAKPNDWILKIPDDVIEHLIQNEPRGNPARASD